MLKIWGRANSINVQKVLWCADEVGLTYDRVDIGGAFGQNHEPFYLALNPNGLVPTIEDDGFVLWESNTIVRYLAGKHSPGNLCPGDLKVRADAERWMDWQLTTALPPMTPVFWGLVRTPPEKRDLKAIETGRQNSAKAWTILDAALAKKAYVAGDRFSIGDIPLGALCYRWFALPIERPELPNLKAWYDRLATRKAYQKHIMVPMT